MARSQAIWAITDPEKTGIDSIIGLFTVKHEMNRFIDINKIDVTKVQLTRMPDGYTGWMKKS